jgi:hypothetical protein
MEEIVMARSDTRANRSQKPDLAAGLRKTLSRGKKTLSPGTRALSSETSQSTPKSTPKPTPKTPSSTAQVPKGGANLPTTGNSANAGLARSLIKRGVGRLVPGVGLILTAVEVAKYLGGGETAASERSNYGGQMGRNRREKESESSQETAERVTREEPFDLTELRMREDLKNPRFVRPAPGSKLEDKGPARSEPPVPQNRPSTVDTRSKKPIAKRIMEALGDKRTMEQATKDREMNQEMERETMGRKKGGMAKKKKAPVKKAYGGMVKKSKVDQLTRSI